MYITQYKSKTFHDFKIHSIANINIFSMSKHYNLSSQRFMTELNSPETHIYISLHGYRECLNSACEREIVEGHIKGKVKTVNFMKSDQQIDVPAENFLYLTPKTLGNVPRLASVHK